MSEGRQRICSRLEDQGAVEGEGGEKKKTFNGGGSVRLEKDGTANK